MACFQAAARCSRYRCEAVTGETFSTSAGAFQGKMAAWRSTPPWQSQLLAEPIVRVGTQAQKERFIKPVLAGEKISALAITEPGGGSDVASLETRAERDGDHYVVTGSKMFITSGCRADFVTTAVRTGGPGHGGVSLLVIERDTPGFLVSKKLKKTK